MISSCHNTIFSNKSKAIDIEWKIETFKQGKKHITNFMIKFKTLAMKTNTDELYVIFLLKKNVQTDIIKTILGYSLMAILETLKKWKIAITLVGQDYKSIESRNEYRTETRTTYRRRGILINIRKSKDNFDKDRKPRCFNYNTYEYIVKEYQKLKRERDIRMYYKYNKVGYLARDYRSE